MPASRKIELMSPAGSFESLHAAIQGGCDSVYFGVGNLNMRANASINFKPEDIHEVSRICKHAGVRSYLTMNTVMFDKDLPAMREILALAKDAKISAVIASDQAVINHASAIGLEIHLSTQLNITNFETIRFYSKFADVAVLARECTLEQMQAICDQIQEHKLCGPSGRLMEIEVFAHGALCMSISGKCYLSLHTRNTSANRGACMQNCRRRYRVIDIEHEHELEIDNEYIMSPKDLCTIGFLDRLIGTGISVLKIEGRGKSADYVKIVTQCYREAIDSVCDGTYCERKVEGWVRRLESVFNRGFWGGYYLGKKLGEWTSGAGSEATMKKVYVGKCTNFYAKIGVGEFLLESTNLQAGDPVMVMGPTTGVVEAIVESMYVDDEGKKDSACKGQVCTFGVNGIVRKADKLYKLVPSNEE
ncbi:MAG: U32 family peptidase [Puniceicoccales bacterium]|jgi:putative protease|nr:U32 family peptidase [Puniceicoccales bacterium]